MLADELGIPGWYLLPNFLRNSSVLWALGYKNKSH